MTTINEQEKQREYYSKRKAILLKGLKQAKLSDALHDLAVTGVAIFGGASFLAGAAILGVNFSDASQMAIAISLGLSGFGAIGCETYSNILESSVDETLKTVQDNDAVIRYGSAMNDKSYMEPIIRMINPRLFKKIAGQPITMESFSELEKDEKQTLVREAALSMKLDEKEFGCKYVDLINENNKEVLEEAKKILPKSKVKRLK